MKRVLTSLLISVVVLTLMSVAIAEAIQPYASEIISSTSIYSTKYSGGKVSFTATIVGTDILDQLGFSSIKIQQNNSGSWSTVKTVYSKYGYGVGSYGYSVSYSGTAGKQYRAVVKYYAKDGSISDTRTRTSSAITAVS